MRTVGMVLGGAAALAPLTGCLPGWQQQTDLGAATTLADVDCVDLTHCWAVGAGKDGTALVLSTEDGHAWELRGSGLPAAGGGLTGVGCTGLSRCERSTVVRHQRTGLCDVSDISGRISAGQPPTSLPR